MSAVLTSSKSRKSIQLEGKWNPVFSADYYSFGRGTNGHQRRVSGDTGGLEGGAVSRRAQEFPSCPSEHPLGYPALNHVNVGPLGKGNFCVCGRYE